MQKNHQPDHQFLQEMGALLATRAGQSSTALPAATHLAEHVTSARRHRQWTRALLAQKMGVTEAEIYALEQGLLSYAELDLAFLSKLAAALGEEIETLLLLLGRPALVQALQMQKADRMRGEENFATSAHAEKYATTSKQRGNPFGYWQWTNALYKGYLNLIDSLRQGRLSSYIRVNYQWYPMAAILLCVFLVGVSTYSIAGRFDAQSDGQANLTIPTQPDALLSTQLPRGTNHLTARSFRPLYPSVEATTYPMTASFGGAVPMVALTAHDMSAEIQQCVVLTAGRPALCRV